MATDDTELSDFFARYLSTFRLAGAAPVKRRKTAEAAIAARLAKGARLFPTASVRLTYLEDPAGARLYGHGEALTVTRQAAIACSAVAGIDTSWWTAASPADRDSVRAALDQGWLGFE